MGYIYDQWGKAVSIGFPYYLWWNELPLFVNEKFPVLVALDLKKKCEFMYQKMWLVVEGDGAKG
jgi:hypothetical protein